MRYWLILIIYSLSLPFLRPLADFLNNFISPAGLSLSLFILSFFILFVYLILKKEKRIGVYLSFLGLTAATYLFMKIVKTETPLEKIHIVEYITLCFLSFIALSRIIKKNSLYFWSIACCFLIAVNDEIIQGIIPGRYFDYNDIMLNFKTILIGHLYVFIIFFREKTALQKPQLLLAILLAAGHLNFTANAQPLKKHSRPEFSEAVRISGKTFILEIAAEPKSYSQGLMYRKKIQDNEGMLFIYPEQKVRNFWMANTLLNLDLIFLNKKGEIIALYEMKAEQPQQETESETEYVQRLTIYSSQFPAQFAIEIKAGQIKACDLKVGQIIPLDIARLKNMSMEKQ